MVDWTRLPYIVEGKRYRNIAVGAVYVILILAVMGALAGEDPEDEGNGMDEAPETTPTATPAADGGTPTSTAMTTPTVTAPPTATSTPTAEPGAAYAIRVTYDGEWQGSLSVTEDGSSTSRSFSGSGEETVEIEGTPDVISANAQKQDDSAGELTIQILENGQAVNQATTSAEYGVAQVSESFY